MRPIVFFVAGRSYRQRLHNALKGTRISGGDSDAQTRRYDFCHPRGSLLGHRRDLVTAIREHRCHEPIAFVVERLAPRHLPNQLGAAPLINATARKNRFISQRATVDGSSCGRDVDSGRVSSGIFLFAYP
jgi:hypothetical protein